MIANSASGNEVLPIAIRPPGDSTMRLTLAKPASIFLAFSCYYRYCCLAQYLHRRTLETYPKTGKLNDEILLLKKFDWGKPIVIGETFPLSCGADDERDFFSRVTRSPMAGSATGQMNLLPR